MSIVERKIPSIVRFSYNQERTDQDYGSCIWADYDLDIENYTITINSDCGNFAYTGWTPTPDHESFFKLLSRINKGYLISKIANKTEIDIDKTIENATNMILSRLDYNGNGLEDGWEEGWNEFYFPETEEGVFIYLSEFVEENNIDMDSEDILGCIVSDYSTGAKKVVDIFMEYIVPSLKEN